MNYEDMIKNAREKIPEPEKAKDRFQVPDVSGRIEGGRTVVTNFFEVADTLRRPPSHLLKFLNRTLATSGKIEGKHAEFKRRLRPKQINEKISDYEEKFVTCPSCGKADTTMSKDGSSYTVKCQACGHEHSFTENL